jgi:hypothetical protein
LSVRLVNSCASGCRSVPIPKVLAYTMVKIRNVTVAVAFFPRNLLILVIKVGNVNIDGNEDFHLQKNVFVLYIHVRDSDCCSVPSE